MQSRPRPGGGKFRQKASDRGRRERMHEFAGISDFFVPGEMLSRASNADKKDTAFDGKRDIGKREGVCFGDTYNSILCRAHTKLGGNE